VITSSANDIPAPPDRGVNYVPRQASTMSSNQTPRPPLTWQDALPVEPRAVTAGPLEAPVLNAG
jgi:hypothetical protein